MSANTRHGKTPDERERAPDEAGVPAEGASEAASASGIEKLTRERDEYLQSWQRATADYQNLRRRVASDVESAVQRSKQALLQDLLLVLDYLDLALAAPCETAEGKAVHAGVEATRSTLLRALEREGVTPVPEEGAFDSAIHEAVERVETDAGAPGTILATLRRGYLRNGAILRPAQVRVAAAIGRAARTDDAEGPAS